MTREEFITRCDGLRYETKYSAEPWHLWLAEMAAHDAEQRRVIEGLSAKVKDLTAWSDRMFGTPCAEIRHQQQVEMLEEKIKQQAQQIATLKSELSQRTNLEGSAPCWNSAHMRQIATLREALENIVEGEGLWTKHDMVHAAQQALKEHKP